MKIMPGDRIERMFYGAVGIRVNATLSITVAVVIFDIASFFGVIVEMAITIVGGRCWLRSSFKVSWFVCYRSNRFPFVRRILFSIHRVLCDKRCRANV